MDIVVMSYLRVVWCFIIVKLKAKCGWVNGEKYTVGLVPRHVISRDSTVHYTVHNLQYNTPLEVNRLMYYNGALPTPVIKEQ